MQGVARQANCVDTERKRRCGLHQPGVYHAARGQAVQYAVAGRAGPLRSAVRTAALRRLRDGHQQRRFRQRKAGRFLAQIDQ